MNLTGTQFLQAAESDPKETSRKVKTYLKQVEQKYNGMNAARCQAAMVSFPNFYEVALPLTGQECTPYMGWEEATRIISLADSSYQPVFKLMQWSIDIVIDAPRTNFYEPNNEPVCNYCGLTQDPS